MLATDLRGTIRVNLSTHQPCCVMMTSASHSFLHPVWLWLCVQDALRDLKAQFQKRGCDARASGFRLQEQVEECDEQRTVRH